MIASALWWRISLLVSLGQCAAWAATQWWVQPAFSTAALLLNALFLVLAWAWVALFFSLVRRVAEAAAYSALERYGPETACLAICDGNECMATP